MKIENVNPNVKQMLQNGVVENAKNLIKEQEAQRMKDALETKRTVTSMIDNKGVYFDSKA